MVDHSQIIIGYQKDIDNLYIVFQDNATNITRLILSEDQKKSMLSEVYKNFKEQIMQIQQNIITILESQIKRSDQLKYYTVLDKIKSLSNLK